MTTRHDFADGKYTVINDNGKLTALRHGEPWGRDLIGDNLVYWMLCEVDKLKINASASVNEYVTLDRECERLRTALAMRETVIAALKQDEAVALAAKDAEIAALKSSNDSYITLANTAYEIAEQRNAEIERLRGDAARWVWWAEAVASHDLNSIEEAFKDVPHDQPTSKQALDAAVDAALKESK